MAPVEKANLHELKAFTTLDGSQIRELAGPAWTKVRNQSLAEATVPPGGETAEHYHPRTEELYYFVAGAGRMRLGAEESEVARRRLRGDRAGRTTQALEPRRGAAGAAVLLRARLLRR